MFQPMTHHIKSYQLILSFVLCLLVSCTTKAQVKISDNEKKEVIDKLKQHLSENFLFKEKGNEMAQFIQNNYDQGKYNNVGTHLDFSKVINKDMKSIKADRHLALIYKPWAKTMIDSVNAANEINNSSKLSFEYMNEQVALITIKEFTFKVKEWEQAMAELTKAKVFIIDLRNNGGGSGHLENQMLSFFLEPGMHYSSTYDRNGKESKTYSQKKIKGDRRLELPIFVLINKNTFSAAEGFTYNLQSLNRAVIIGEQSRGGAHPKRNFKINNNYFLSLPILRIENINTKTDWEGTGIIPDIASESSEALKIAYNNALELLNMEK